jgi:SOS-response transcriptional repressor LexA
MEKAGCMLTRRQRFVLEFIEAYKRKWGVVPTYRVIAIGCKVKSCGGTYRLVGALRDKGYISKDRGRYDIVVKAGDLKLSADSGQGVGGGQEEDQGSS